ncbi:MAG: mandelate racemase [Pseudomonadales bacterium]|nr:mandelate racemase [Pseudomonadales bacterium]MCP5185053.1 mandelate racemase [Pseudomonadales bacterium]
MRIVELRELTVPLEGRVANAVVNFSAHTVSLVAAISDQYRNGRPVVGLAFNSIGRFGQSGILRERLFPRVLSADPEALLNPETGCFDPARVAEVAMRNEKPGGHGDRAIALGALELATWDLLAKLADEPAWRTIARAFGHPVTSDRTPVYAAGGYYYPNDSTARLVDELQRYRDLGYTAFKMKIGGATLREDMLRIEAALTVAGTGANLCVDANGRFDLETALAYAKAFSALELRWYEEAGDPLDYALNQSLIQQYAGPVATGENLFSRQDVANLVRYGGMRQAQDVFQMDAGLCYGLTEYAAMVELLEGNGFNRRQCHPHGGHLLNLHIAIGLGLGGCEAYPGVFQPFGGYPAECGVGDGFVRPTDAPGFGLEQKAELATCIERLVG